MDTCQSDIIQPLLKKRIGNNKVDRTIIDDVLNIFSATDEIGARGLLPLFCAASLTRIPTVPDDLSELAGSFYQKCQICVPAILSLKVCVYLRDGSFF